MPRIPDQTKRERLNRVEALLRRSDGLTEREVAEILNFERRTAHNYLRELDLEGKAYKEGQLWFPLPYHSPVLRQFELHPEEAMVLYLAARLFVKQSDQRNEAAENVLVKLADILSNDMGLSDDIHHAALQLAQRPVVEGYEDVFRTIMRAYIHRRKVEIVYHPYRGGPFTTTFAPYLLEPSAIGFATYAIGYSSVVDALRTYKLERIQRAKLLITEEYTIPRDFPGHELLANAWSIYHGEETTRVVLRFHPSVARRVQETNWHSSQHLETDDDQPDYVKMTLHVAATTDLVPWIRGWGASCEVLEPAELRRAIKREVRQLAGLYAVAANPLETIPQYYAHSRQDADEHEWQLLIDHLNATSNIAAEMAGPLGIADLARITGLLHDIGKYSQEFQARLRGSSKRVDHATAGAIEITQLFPANPLADLIAYCIAGHHTGLPDYGNPSDLTGSTLAARLKKDLPDYSSYQQEIDSPRLQLLAPRLRLNREHPGFSLSFLTRMLFSVLVDADWLETEQYMQGQARPRGQHVSIEALANEFNHYLEHFNNPQTDINYKRTETLYACLQNSSLEQGYFTLTVPTGGGKTLASMAFALNHAEQHNLNRVIYVLPFTSIIEQNADVFRQALGDLGAENVLEHHSNYDWEKALAAGDDETNQMQVKLRLATENWDIPIVVTTNVQFFESLFASQKSRARKLHNIANSVIVLDEVQLLPREYLKPCMVAVQELVQNYHVTAVFCTATQPALDRFFPADIHFAELAPTPQDLFNFYRRVEVKNLGTQSDEALAERLNNSIQALCIVNTRRHARGLFDLLDSEGNFHLSTLMCPAHRRETLEEVRYRLTAGLPCRVVSTSVMEAGIDVDFPVGYRALAGLDSIIQAAGRVNRERKQPSAEMFVYSPDTPFIKRMPGFIKQTGAVAQAILRDHAEDPTTIAAIEAYYEMLYALNDKDAFDAMQVIPLLDKGPNSVAFSFAEAADRFRLISQNTVAVIIPYDELADDLITELQHALFPRSILRRLQTYTVNIYEHEFENLQSKGVIYTIADSYHVLDETHISDWYCHETGLRLAEADRGDAIFFDG